MRQGKAASYKTDVHALSSRLSALVAPTTTPPLILAEPWALSASRRADVRRHPEPLDPAAPLDTSGRSYLHAGHRRDEALEVLRFPVLGCVLDGEADYRIADHILSLKAGSFFVVPPGVPQPDGTRPHWERPEPQGLPNETLWLVPLPSGAFVGSCRVEEGEHRVGWPRVFLPDDRLLALTDMLIDALRRSSEYCDALPHALLRALVLSVCADLRTSLPTLAPPLDESARDVAPVVRRVLDYVDSHLHEHLSLARLASAAHLSIPHLQRLFKAQMGVSVMQHVNARRMEQARQLLACTDLPVSEVARLVGFAYPAHFTRSFRQATDMAPGTFRNTHRNDPNW